jgi:hypothetical protein
MGPRGVEPDPPPPPSVAASGVTELSIGRAEGSEVCSHSVRRSVAPAPGDAHRGDALGPGTGGMLGWQNRGRQEAYT